MEWWHEKHPEDSSRDDIDVNMFGLPHRRHHGTRVVPGYDSGVDSESIRQKNAKSKDSLIPPEVLNKSEVV